MTGKKIHYAWFILLGIILIRGFAGGGINMTAGLFLAPVSSDIGVGIGTLSIYFSISSIVMVIWLPIAGKLINKYDVRLMSVIGGLLQIIPFILFGYMNSVYAWYVLAVPQAMGAAIIVNLLGPILINRWFASNAGMMMGIQMAFVGLFGAVLQPLASKIISDKGWRTAYLYIGVLSLVVVLLTAFALLKNSPKDKQLVRYGEGESDTAEVSQKNTVQAIEIDEKTAVRSASFYLLLLFMFALTGVGVFTQHIPNYGAMMGYTLQETGIVLAFAAIGSAIGAIVIGIVCDRIGVLKTCYGVILLGILAITGFLLSSEGIIIFCISTFVHGLVTSSIMVLSPILALSFYGQKDYESIYAKIAMGAPLASILLVPAYGFVFDITDNYFLVLISMAVLLLISGFCIAFGWKKRCTIDGCPGWRR